MQVNLYDLIGGARKASGLTVIIDVFRAFTVAPIVLANGADKIIPVQTIEEAFELKQKYPERILMGERKGVKPDGFDYGNSPHIAKSIDFKGKTVVMTTSAGTRGLLAAQNAQEIITGSFVNISAIVDYIKARSPEVVSIVSMGARGEVSRDEDVCCAKFIRNALEGKENDFNEIVEHLKSYRSASKFFDPSKANFPEGDFWCAMDINSYDFVVRLSTGPMQLERIDSMGQLIPPVRNI